MGTTMGAAALGRMIAKLKAAKAPHPVAERLDALVAVAVAAADGRRDMAGIEVLFDSGVGPDERRAFTDLIVSGSLTIDQITEAVEKAKRPRQTKTAKQPAA